MPGPREQPRWHRDTRRCWGSGVQVGPPPQCGAPTGRREGPADVNPPAARAPRGSARAGRWQYLQLLVLLAVDLQGLPDVLGDLQLLVLEGGPELAGQDDGVDPKRRLLVRGPLLVLLADVGVDAAGVRHILEAKPGSGDGRGGACGAGRAGRGCGAHLQHDLAEVHRGLSEAQLQQLHVADLPVGRSEWQAPRQSARSPRAGPPSGRQAAGSTVPAVRVLGQLRPSRGPASRDLLPPTVPGPPPAAGGTRQLLSGLRGTRPGRCALGPTGWPRERRRGLEHSLTAQG